MRSTRVPLGLAAAAALAALLAPSRAGAMSCIGHAYERMALELRGVDADGKPSVKPPELGDVDELLNSGAGGRGVLLWHRGTMIPAKFYLLAEERPPTPRMKGFIDATKKRSLMTACRYPVRYTPILPGRYVFEQEHSSGAKVPVGIEEPVVEVHPGRAQVDLSFKVGGRSFRARYAVKCAFFEWEGEPAPCAPSDPVDPADPAAKVGDPPPPAAPPPSATHERPPDVVAEAVPAPRGGCAGCSSVPVSPGHGAWAGAALLAAMARRKRWLAVIGCALVAVAVGCGQSVAVETGGASPSSTAAVDVSLD